MGELIPLSKRLFFIALLVVFACEEKQEKDCAGSSMELPSAAVRTVPHRTMTAQLPTMMAAAWIVPELKAGTPPSAAVRIVRLLTIT